MALPLSLELATESLGWPDRKEIFDPPGSAASVFAKNVQHKLELPLSRRTGRDNLKFGVLMEDPNAATSEPPLAIVAESDTEIQQAVLREIQRLSWNFSYVATVITVEPKLLRAWTCCEAPDPNRDFNEYLVESFSTERVKSTLTPPTFSDDSNDLHWFKLVSGTFFEENGSRFERDGRADHLLLGNLQFLRSELSSNGLADDICHDLIARVIFVQFLFDRTDADGRAALSPERLYHLHSEGVLSKRYESLAEVLSSHQDTYSLFKWLNQRFNGDLFPSQLSSKVLSAEPLTGEIDMVSAEHLQLLADFIRGDIEMPANQYCLWPQYSFDVIPLEFISSIYESFVGNKASTDGVYYTPSNLVDTLLDQVLPWEGTNWDIKVLDPACGSGVFLVKSFQRLVHRWKNANRGEVLRVSDLQGLLQQNIFGVDKDPTAVRVASFSLYLAMCDEIDPKDYWAQVIFPTMREERIVCSDFFEEGKLGFDTMGDANSFDLVVGNAPFGAGVITDSARRWALEQEPKWTIPNRDIGGLFLAKAALLAGENGKVAMIQSANTILFNISKAASFRKELLSRHTVETIFNLAALRRSLFKGSKSQANSVAPVCIVIMKGNSPPLNHKIQFVSPKFTLPLVDDFRILIEPWDCQEVSMEAAIAEPHIWAELMWAHPRDVNMVRRLRVFPTLNDLKKDKSIVSRVGVVYGDKKNDTDRYNGLRLFNNKIFPNGDFLYLDADALPMIDELSVHSRDSSRTDAFQCPQLILKRSWSSKEGRFQSRISRSRNKSSVLCDQSFVSVHGEQDTLISAAATFNSSLAVYLLFHTSGRFAAYRPKLAVSDVLSTPLPLTPIQLQNIQSYHQLDTSVFDAFELKDSERILIEDCLKYTIGDFLGGDASLGRLPTAVTLDEYTSESHLRSFCECFVRVLQAGFGNDRVVTSTIYRSNSASNPVKHPYRLVSFSLGGDSTENIEICEVENSSLLDILHRVWNNGRENHRFAHTRVARTYEVITGLPTIFMVKPDQKRYWTRSMGLNDGDEVSLDLFKWQRDRGNQESMTH